MGDTSLTRVRPIEYSNSFFFYSSMPPYIVADYVGGCQEHHRYDESHWRAPDTSGHLLYVWTADSILSITVIRSYTTNVITQYPRRCDLKGTKYQPLGMQF